MRMVPVDILAELVEAKLQRTMNGTDIDLPGVAVVFSKWIQCGLIPSVRIDIPVDQHQSGQGNKDPTHQ